MQRECTTTYMIIGNESDIKYLHKELLKLVHRKKTEVKHIASVFCPQWTNYNPTGIMTDIKKINPRQITFEIKTENEPESEVWGEICRKYQSSRYYYYSALSHKGHYKTSDLSGKYFPHRFIVINKEGIPRKLFSQVELFEYVASIIPVSKAFDTLENFGIAISKYLNLIKIFDIILVDERGRCLTKPTNMIGQYI